MQLIRWLPTGEALQSQIHQNLHESNPSNIQKKELLIEMVLNQNFSIYRASKKLKISNSTAKSIITNYNKYGTILERNTKSSI